MRGLISAGVALVGVFIASVLIREDVRHSPETYTLHPINIKNENAAIEKFALALTYPTLGNPSAPNHIGEPAPFQHLHTHLERSFPTVYEALTVEKVNEYSLLMTWPGSDPSLTTRPVILVSHLDVVPATGNWTHPPFSGTIADGFVWGRGAMDTKISLTGILEAIAQLLDTGFSPQRTVLLAFGHDEELSGAYGAGSIAKLLEKRGIEAEILLDEGGVIKTDGLKAGNIQLLEGHLAGVGTAAKGSQNWKITVKGEGGHSSMPPTGKGTSIAARVARILMRFESQQTSTRLLPPTIDFLKNMAPALRYAPLRTLFGLADNPIFNPLLGQFLGQLNLKEMAAMVRTTVAMVRLEAGTTGARNVMPEDATIDFNLRTLPGEDAKVIKEYVDLMIQKESAEGVARAEMQSISYLPTSVTPASGPNWDLIVRAITESLSPKESGPNKSTVGKMTVVPMLCTGGTDAIWYEKVAGGRIFRFNPLRVSKAGKELDRLHGIDERLSVEDYLDAVRFYIRFLQLSAGDAPEDSAAAQ